MRPIWRIAPVAVALLVARRSQAQTDPHVGWGFWLGARVAIAAPFGNALRPNGSSGPMGAQSATGGPVSEASTSGALLPFQLDGGYRLGAHWHVGGYFQIADAFSGTACSSCGGYDARFGVTGEYHVTPQRRTDGWIGLGVGYEILHTSSSGSSLVTAYRGFEYAGPEAGLDFRIGASRVRWGPWTALAFGEYDHVRQISPTSDVSITPSETLHGWFFLGVRTTVDL